MAASLTPGPFKPCIMVHGGAWQIEEYLLEDSRVGVQEAVQRGYKALLEGKPVLDAVIEAVCSLEDNPAFDAGTGSCLNKAGEVEMDAMIMDGKTLKYGAVAAVQNVKNPVKLARLVMDKTDHCLLVGAGATKFAEEMQVEMVAREQLVSKESLAEYERFLQYKQAVNTLFNNRLIAVGGNDPQSGHDTVGAVAMDQWGNLACATSTGGITLKRVGRVGDSPIVGCGGFANDVGCVSTTGHGESILRTCLARNVVFAMETMSHETGSVKSVNDACMYGLNYMQDKVNGCGGVIAINSKGECGYGFTTGRMAWAKIETVDGKTLVTHGIEPGEEIVYPLEL